MKNVLGVILGGGKGTRLLPLTRSRAKPAVPLAGKYRLIDIPISNCINSNLHSIYVLTQFNSVSLHRHIRQSYTFDRFRGGFVEILAAQQTFGDRSDWFQGTADAVRKNLRYIDQPDVEYVLILSGDQLYRMDYRDLLRTHREADADVTIAAVPVSAEQASAFGILQFDGSGRVTGFHEKPKTEQDLGPVRTDPAWIDAHGIESRGRDCLASMGIYLFNRKTLVELLTEQDCEDFGGQLLPRAITSRRVQVHLFGDYWEDIGTIKAFYDANLALAGPDPPFDFVVDDAPIYTRPRFLPPTRIEGAAVRRSLVADGCVMGDNVAIENSVIGLRCQIQDNVTIRDSVLMGSDYYGELPRGTESAHQNVRPMIIGAGCTIERAIIDRNCRVGRNVRIEPSSTGNPPPGEGMLTTRDGIVVLTSERAQCRV